MGFVTGTMGCDGELAIPIRPHHGLLKGVIMSARAFARVDGLREPHCAFAGCPRYGTLRGVGQRNAPSFRSLTRFKLNFTPVSVIANPSRTPMTRRLGQSFTPPVQTSLDPSRRTKMEETLNAPQASNMQP